MILTGQIPTRPFGSGCCSPPRWRRFPRPLARRSSGQFNGESMGVGGIHGYPIFNLSKYEFKQWITWIAMGIPGVIFLTYQPLPTHTNMNCTIQFMTNPVITLLLTSIDINWHQLTTELTVAYGLHCSVTLLPKDPSGLRTCMYHTVEGRIGSFWPYLQGQSRLRWKSPLQKSVKSSENIS